MFASHFSRLTLDSTLAELPVRTDATGPPTEIRLPGGCRIAHAVQRIGEHFSEPIPESIDVEIAGGIRRIDTRVLLMAHASILERVNEEVMRQKAVAESATRAKSAFLADMSHDIRTPMNGILGMTDLALETHLAPEQREYLQIVRSSAESLLTLLNDILDFSKIEAGKLDLDSFDFNLRDGMADALRSLAMRADEKGLELALDVASDVPDALHADWGRLRQVLTNLIGNALKFTDHGEIIVRVEKQNHDREPMNRAGILLRFSVTDTGIGIPTDRVAQIFEPYMQADSSTSRSYGGTGLGLTISSRLVQMMGGRLWVESKVGKGSSFHFTARVGLSQKATDPPYTLEPEGLDGLPVLVVDDNSTNRQILRELLTTWSMSPSVADGGETALAALEHAAGNGKPFALVLLDALMPGMDGFAVAEQIRGRPGLAGATIMMLSSSHRHGDTARCRELGVPRYLTKPLKQSDLFDAILDVLSAKAPTDKTTRRETSQTPPALLPSRRFRVLLAEDNAVNQKLAVSLLAKQGHEVIVAHDGREATAALEREAFDLVLMDLEMPNMNGLEATAHIRAREANTGRHTPIVAMTAHAMKGDRERCLAGGMDGYLAKPIRASQLTQVLADFDVLGTKSKAASTQSAIHATTHDHPDGDILDRAAILSRVGHDSELLHDLVAVFLDECPKLIGKVRVAVEQGDPQKLKVAAHSLKGAVSNFSTWPAFEAALRLETMGHTGDLTHAAEGLAALEAALARLTPALSQLMVSV